MSRWADLVAAHPEFAAELESAFTRHPHCVLGTLRSDGSPRLTGIEVSFWRGDLMLGMMPDSHKARDLDRDPRFELHSAPIDTDLRKPDARLWGRAERVTSRAEIAAFAQSLPHDGGDGDTGMELFRARLMGAALTRVAGDLLVVDSWRPGTPPQRVSRR